MHGVRSFMLENGVACYSVQVIKKLIEIIFKDIMVKNIPEVIIFS